MFFVVFFIRLKLEFTVEQKKISSINTTWFVIVNLLNVSSMVGMGFNIKICDKITHMIHIIPVET